MLPLAAHVIAHVGGIPTKAEFVTPVNVGDVSDASFALTWTDNEQDMTGKLNFYYQPSNARPGALPTSTDFAGDPIVGDVAILDPTNTYAWDTSAVPSGSYFAYEITRDEPLMPLVAVAKRPFTIQHPGDPRFPAVVVSKPDGIGDTQARRFAVKWQAAGEGALTATIRAQDKDAETPFEELASNVAMRDLGGGLYEGCWEWNVELMPQANYTIQVEVANEGGQTHSSFGAFPVVVARDASHPETGEPPSCDVVVITPDGGTVAAVDGGGGGGGGGGCSIAPRARGRGHGLAAPFALAGVLVWPFKRRRRRRDAA